MPLTDAATRFRYDLKSHAWTLAAGSQKTLIFVHTPYSFPEGCSGAYELRVEPRRQQGVAANDIFVGCDGTPNFKALGYTYSTGLSEPFLPVESYLAVRHAAGEPAVVVLERAAGDKVRLAELR